ncbi:MAG: lytic transglycosylase domain-containing protein [Myxococcota bacterium]
MRIPIVALTAALLLPAVPAGAHLYKCTDEDGRVWIRNYKPADERCRISMRIADPEPSRGGGDKAKAKKKKESFRPPEVGRVPRPVEEPGSIGERMSLYEPYIEEASEQWRIPADFIRAVIRVESSFHYRATSEVGAKGLMQLMPKTARAMGVRDAFDPKQNILGGARLLRVLANRYDGDFVKVLSAYHAGSGAVAAKGGIPYEGTEGYVRAVLDHYYRYKTLGTDG